MTKSTDFDRLVASWLEADGPADVRREVVEAAFASARRIDQRRGVRAWLAGPPTWPTGRPPLPLLRPIVLVVVVALVLIAAAVLVGGLRHAPSPLSGELTPTGTLHQPLVDPVTVVLPDGRVGLIGATLDLKLHMETWDPATGAFSVAPGLDDRRFSHGRGQLGVTALADGSLLIVIQHASSVTGASEGGYALLYDSIAGVARQTGGFDARVAEASPLADYAFASWPTTVDPDGRVTWTPAPWQSASTVIYDPIADRFIAGHVSDGAQPTFPAVVEVLDSERRLDGSSIVHLDDGRYLMVGGSSDPNQPAALVDGGTFAQQPLDWPLVRGGTYEAVKLRDGRVLVVGPTAGVFNPGTEQFRELDVEAAMTLVTTLDDGRVVLQARGPVPLGAAERDRLLTFDPATDALARLGPDVLPYTRASWTALPDGRVLVVNLDLEPSPDAGLAWTMR